MTDLIFVPPEKRDLTLGGELLVDSAERQLSSYLVNGRLHKKLELCPHCGHNPLSSTGRYNFVVTDLPHIDAANRVWPVRYSITAPRFVCAACKKIVVQPRPTVLNPIETQALLTRRMSEWLISQLQSPLTYQVLARSAGYSEVWLRKWYVDVRKEMDLPPKGGFKAKHRESLITPILL